MMRQGPFRVNNSTIGNFGFPMFQGIIPQRTYIPPPITHPTFGGAAPAKKAPATKAAVVPKKKAPVVAKKTAKKAAKKAPVAKKVVKKAATAPAGVPTLTRWKQNPDGSISGRITGSKSFRSGTEITTSPDRKSVV